MRRVWVANKCNNSLKPARDIVENEEKERANSEIGVTILADPPNAKGFVSMENTSQKRDKWSYFITLDLLQL